MALFRGHQIRYRCFMTPLTDVDTNTYGSELDVSDRIKISGIGSIKRSLDSTDYNLGLFVFQDLTLKGKNHNGYFNDESDYRSIFNETRDLCKVRIEFEEVEITRDSSGKITSIDILSTSTFRGLVNEEATKINAETDEISFKVLSRDSVFRTTKIPAGVVASSATIKAAISSILNDPKITSVLNFDENNINPDLNIQIDDGSVFDNIPVNEGLNQLLLVSNSILYTTDAGDIIVKNRDEDEDRPLLNLYGKSDLLGRENINGIKDYNLGIHRTFTSFKLETTEMTDTPSVMTYGYRQKKIEADFITDGTKRQQIATRLLDEFKTPRAELKVEVPTRVAKSLQLLDRVSINYPLRVKPQPGKFLPIVGAAVIGDPETPLPDVFGSLIIHPSTAWKVIEIEDRPASFLSILKLRQINDFVFNKPGNCLVSFAIIGESVICEGGTPCDTYNPSNIGAAQVGCTEVS